MCPRALVTMDPEIMASESKIMETNNHAEEAIIAIKKHEPIPID